MYHFPDTDQMPERPALPVPDYAALAQAFHAAMLEPKNKVLRHRANGHPRFGAYLLSDSDELVTWGILAIGEWISGRDPAWIAVSYPDFFVPETGLYMNFPGGMVSEFWYLFYVNTLAGAVLSALYPHDAQARTRMGAAADGMALLAEKMYYDFNQQGYRFDQDAPFTDKPIFRQPDSIAGYAYNMLFAARRADRPQYLARSVEALERYQAFEENPWYEIPNGSAGLLAACWLNAHGHALNVQKIAGWVFDHAQGPLQTGTWGGEQVDGLMMGWRNKTRAAALGEAYSMETLMPLQFLLPAMRYCPQLADAVGKWVRCVLSNFQLFYARGTQPLHETRPELDARIPYEKLEKRRGPHSPVACGDFHGERSVYGAGYLDWLAALARPTNDPDLFALDLSLTDWLAEERYPVFLLRNPAAEARTVRFTPAPVWQKLRPELYETGTLHAALWDAQTGAPLKTDAVPVPANGFKIVALLPKGVTPALRCGCWVAGQAELVWRDNEE